LFGFGLNNGLQNVINLSQPHYAGSAPTLSAFFAGKSFKALAYIYQLCFYNNLPPFYRKVYSAQFKNF